MDIRAAKKGTVINGEKTPEKVTPNAPVPEVDGTVSAPASQVAEDILIEQYHTYLKEHDISDEDIHDILSALITEGNVEWSFNLLNTIPVKFDVRKTWVNDLIIEKIDTLTRKNESMSSMRYNNLIATYNLAGSLKQYGDTKFIVSNEESFDKSVEFVNNLSYIIQNALITKLAVFDRAIAVATSDWALKNFTNPQKVG